MLVLTACAPNNKMAAAARFSRLYEEVSAASALDFEKTVTVTLSTERGIYDLSQTARVKAFKDGRRVTEYEAKEINREVEYCSFCDGVYSYVPLYDDVYVRRPAELLDFASVVPFAGDGLTRVMATIEDGREVYMAVSDDADVVNFVSTALSDSFDLESMAETAVYGPVTVFIGRDAEDRFVALSGEVVLGSVRAEYRVEIEVYGVNELEEIKYPLEEEEIAEIGSYTDFIKSLYPIAKVAPRSAFTVLFGFDPGEDFDFFSFDFNDYRGVLYWDAFFEAIK